MNLSKAIGWLSISTAALFNVSSAFSFPASHSLHSSPATFIRKTHQNGNQYKSTSFVSASALSATEAETATTGLTATASTFGTTITPFDDGTSPFEITTPIYYVNDKPHIGHAYTSVACDVIARFMRLSGREVFFLSGTDEHGQKVEQSAAKRNMEPQDFVDEISQSFRDLLLLMNISNDEFIRTTSGNHKEAVQVSVID
jgi:methionyl-tRNA synthetase